jgi:hypothetical protein
MRALILCTLVVVGCGGNANQAGDMAAPSFSGTWSGSLMHAAVTCTDGSVLPAFTTSTAWQINQDQVGIFLIWTDRCPLTPTIAFAVDGNGAAKQQGDPVTCVDSSMGQAVFSGGVMTLAGDALTMSINETIHNTGTQNRDCAFPVSVTMTRQ